MLSNYSDEQSAQISLIENTHREALNPIAEALAMKRLAEEFRYTHDEIGVLLGVSRASLNLPNSNMDNAIKNISVLSENTNAHSISSENKSSESLAALEQKLSHQFKSPVTITLNQNDTGSFNIHFHNRTDMHAILQKLNCDDANI